MAERTSGQVVTAVPVCVAAVQVRPMPSTVVAVELVAV